MEKQFFGTDGIRGKVGSSPIDAPFMLRLGYAIGHTLAGGQRKVLIGKDTRISGYMLEAALQAGLSSAGVDIHLLGPLPTPGVAYLATTFRAGAGIVISASHNPYTDNGVKFFTSEGEKLPEAIELAIESALAKPPRTVASESLGKAYRIHDAVGRYIEFCKRTLDSRTKLNGLRIVVDCANGATYNVAPKVFSELGALVIPIGVQPNGLNINETGAVKPQHVRHQVLKHEADLGIAFDGDGDRAVLIDHRGEIADGDDILFIIAKSRMARGIAVGGVVGTKVSNLGLEEALAGVGVQFVRAEVGEHFVQSELRQRGWQLGGESSGHVICRDKTSTGDGIVSALQVVEAILSAGTSLHEFKQGMNKYRQGSAAIRIPQGVDVLQVPQLRDALSEVQAKLRGKGRAMLRRSGTESVVRVLVESRDESDIKHYIAALSGEVRRAAGRQQ